MASGATTDGWSKRGLALIPAGARARTISHVLPARRGQGMELTVQSLLRPDVLVRSCAARKLEAQFSV
jgi:hypothetical protein